jgi:HSP20 family protein
MLVASRELQMTMTLTKLHPMWPVMDANYSGRLGRLFEQMLESPLQREESGSLLGRWIPPVDVVEEGDTIRLVAELPGVKVEDVRISLENNVLTVQGEKKQEAVQDDDKAYRFERAYGMFERTFTLPATIDANKIVAKFDSGLLTILLPKVEAAKPRHIAVKIEK